jgi:hypothetical protein
MDPCERGLRAAEKPSGKNTIDLQWKMRANYNARPCDGERKAAGAGTMPSNGKSNARARSKQSEIGARSRPIVTTARQAAGAARAALPTDRICSRDLWMSLSAQHPD